MSEGKAKRLFFIKDNNKEQSIALSDKKCCRFWDFMNNKKISENCKTLKLCLKKVKDIESVTVCVILMKMVLARNIIK